MEDLKNVAEAWFSIPIVQLCAVLFVALGVVLGIRALKGSLKKR